MLKLLFLLLLPYLALVVNAQAINNSNGEKASNVFVGDSIMRGPYLQNVTSSGVTIRWRTGRAVKSRVYFGTQKEAMTPVDGNDTPTTEHLVVLNQLASATRYFYSVGGKALEKETYNFVTLPPAGTIGTYRIGVFGDCGRLSDNQLQVTSSFVQYIKDKPINAWILLGDNAYYRGTDVEFQRNFFQPYKENLLPYFPFFPAPGNHDYKYRRSARRTKDMPYYKVFSMPSKGEAGGVASDNAAYYSFDIGNVHFISLDSYGIEKDGTRLFDTGGLQVNWLKRDLEAYQQKKGTWLIAYWHHPPYSMGTHNSDKKRDLKRIRKKLLPVLERYGVDLVLTGHSHTYERTKLMKGHFGKEKSFSNKHILKNSSGRYDGSANSCPYIKSTDNNGTVYVVTGSAGALGGRQKSFPHNAMYYSNDSIGGASLIEVTENKLTFQWISADGLVRDSFVMMKDVNKKHDIKLKRGDAVSLSASFVGTYLWSNGNHSSRSIKVMPDANAVYRVKDAYGCMEDVFTVKVQE